jgi:hypothetical protein
VADFCWTCLAGGIYPEHPERNDLHGLCAAGEVVDVLCEGCGFITVDHEGKPVEQRG